MTSNYDETRCRPRERERERASPCLFSECIDDQKKILLSMLCCLWLVLQNELCSVIPSSFFVEAKIKNADSLSLSLYQLHHTCTHAAILPRSVSRPSLLWFSFVFLAFASSRLAFFSLLWVIRFFSLALLVVVVVLLHQMQFNATGHSFFFGSIGSNPRFGPIRRFVRLPNDQAIADGRHSCDVVVVWRRKP